MPTRRLIALALMAGLAILLAGGIWMVLQLSDGDETVAPPLALGEAADLSGLQAVVLAIEPGDGQQVKLEVEMHSAERSLDDAGRGWAVATDVGQLLARTEGDGASCLGQTLERGATLTCSLLFDGSEISRTPKGYVALFSDGDRSVRWRLPA